MANAKTTIANPITPAQAAKRLHMDVSRVYVLIRAGRIRAAKWGRSYMVDPDGLDYRPLPPGRPVSASKTA